MAFETLQPKYSYIKRNTLILQYFDIKVISCLVVNIFSFVKIKNKKDFPVKISVFEFCHNLSNEFCHNLGF